jgi:hypothetical protein
VSSSLAEFLVKIGGRRWTPKAGLDRVYVTVKMASEAIGLRVSYYGSGNVSGATLDGERDPGSRPCLRIGSRTAPKPFLLCRWVSSQCDKCDADDAGIFNRVDHGCTVEVELAAHKTLVAAKLHGGRVAKDGTTVTVYDADGDAVWSQ